MSYFTSKIDTAYGNPSILPRYQEILHSFFKPKNLTHPPPPPNSFCGFPNSLQKYVSHAELPSCINTMPCTKPMAMNYSSAKQESYQ